MTVKEDLLNKNALSVMKLAETLNRYRPGERLPRISDLANDMGLSVGTTQYGLTFLREKKAVLVKSKGHLGTFIDAVDYEKLREYTGNSPRACVMPLPYSLRYEGLATAFSELGNKSGKFYLAFMNGSSRRIRALLERRYDCALMSRMTAEKAITQKIAIDVAIDYGPQSFLETHVLVHRTRTSGRVKTIGLDKESMDQVLLSKSFLAAHPKIRVVNLPYTHIIRRLLAGDVDATLWNLDYIKEHHPLLQFTHLNDLAIQPSMTEAVLVIRSGDIATANYLSRYFPKQKVLKTQEAVFRGSRLPKY